MQLAAQRLQGVTFVKIQLQQCFAKRIDLWNKRYNMRSLRRFVNEDISMVVQGRFDVLRGSDQTYQV